jgi:hypothetical protein
MSLPSSHSSDDVAQLAGVAVTDNDGNANQIGGPYRAASVVRTRRPPKPLVVRHQGNELIIEGHPGWFPWKVILRIVFSIGLTAGAVYAPGSLRVVLGLPAAMLWVATGLLLRNSAVRTTLTIRPSTARLDRRGPFLQQRIEAPLSDFTVQGVSDLYREEGDQVPIFYLACSFGDRREKLFVAHPANALEWIRDEIKLWRDNGFA